MAYIFVFLGCAPTTPTHEPPKATQVKVWREFELVMHADDAFPEDVRAQLDSAAAAWVDLTEGNVRIKLVYDLDFSSVENLKSHKVGTHALVIGLLSDMKLAQELDKHFASPGVEPLAATVTPAGEPSLVFLIVDRIPRAQFREVMTHELGHVIGLPDLPTFGDVMSGREVKGFPVPDKFTPADKALCERFRYCVSP